MTDWPEGQDNGAATLGVAGTMRAWLVRGTRRFAVDPRRRFGRHGDARRLLSADGEAPATPHGAWGGLVSALQRHTVHGELAQLSPEDRQILSLAYLSGHTNREIASMLSVSVSTVRRRLSIALARLEESMRRAGMWVSALLLGILALYQRLSHSARAAGWQNVAVVAAGTVTAVTIGVVVVNPGAPSAGATTNRVQVAQPGFDLPKLGAPVSFVTTTTPDVPETIAGVNPKGHQSTGDTTDSNSGGQTSKWGCHGNPTDAPPDTPVGTRGPHPGSPVTHPGKGGCGPHAT